MSYNNIGLSTTRGSATNGFVQRNLSHFRPRDEYGQRKYAGGRDNSEKAGVREPDREILEHERKRRLEVRCMELRVRLEDDGAAEEEIERQVNALRQHLTEETSRVAKSKDNDMAGYSRQEIKALRPSDTHAWGAAKAGETRNMSRALGIKSDYREGDAFDRELQERRRQERQDERKRRDEERQREAESRRRENERRERAGRAEDGRRLRTYDDRREEGALSSGDEHRRYSKRASPAGARRRSRSLSSTPSHSPVRRRTDRRDLHDMTPPSKRRARDRSLSSSSYDSRARSPSPRRRSARRANSRSPIVSRSLPVRGRYDSRSISRTPSRSRSPSPRRQKVHYPPAASSMRSRSRSITPQRRNERRRSRSNSLEGRADPKRARSPSISSSRSAQSTRRNSALPEEASRPRAPPPGPPPVRPPGL